MTGYDKIVEADAEEECRAWIRRLIDAKDEVVAFVDARLNGGGAGTYKGFFKGSFNLSYHIDFGDRRPSVLIRFAMPGESATPWRAEKVANEVRFIEYLRENTSIPYLTYTAGDQWRRARGSWGHLSSWTSSGGLIYEATLDKVYEQIADYMLQISCLAFSRIGAISKDDGESGTWTVTGRPLTFDMNILATSTGYPVDQFHTAPLDLASDFFELVARQHLLHLDTQRNLADDEADAQRRFVARQRFKQLIPKYCTDNAGPFRIFCDDMQPSNMLIDPDTLRITAMLDFEFTNSMPAQFAYDPPWWLLLRGPGIWIEDDGMDDFLASYSSLARGGGPAAELRLSTRMRESWRTGRFWFNYAARRCLDVDIIYWEALHDHGDGDGLSLLDPATRAEARRLVRTKMEQLSPYKAECATPSKQHPKRPTPS
ncbi:hypothetical protein QBC33DRAFT_596497 [Phialemonium atrogriseum]|uniref:Aminoglycoside phosphotransferase domain-containing protein n=1 Tax=Phialemonium atrogriseum TaxID=1093897 RepID=A0AAJ0BVF7_9PEZI|nr:uncharacterized protein QBC33DRAFT_596497 [Phialemonium atrogriseum]KAK1763804.1 hypothetical protein QBC33DRAFT_596497 [Phialemonium atrogriseum]